MVNNVNAQTWLNEKYPIDGVCKRDNDPENKNKRRKDITKLDISKESIGGKWRDKVLVGSLNLEGFTNLQVLIISSHELTGLDIGGRLSLEELDCRNNKINNLNLSGFRYLSKVNCSNNNIKELKLNDCVELSQLNCISNKHLKEVDISDCSKLVADAIESDLCHNAEKGKLTKSVSQITPVRDNDVRNILIIGITGNGKSALANTLSDTDQFEEGSHSTSVTKNFQKSNAFEWGGKKYRIIDNIGFSDTSNLTVADLLYEIGKGICSAQEGINQVLFVFKGRFSEDQIRAFNLFKDFIDETGITRFTTIVKTNFKDFRKEEIYKKDQQDLLNEENKDLSKIIKSCNDIIYVDNPPIPVAEKGDSKEENKKKRILINKKKRKESREKILNYLAENCREIYKLKEWDSIHNQVINYMRQIEEKQEELRNTDSDLEKNRLKGEIKERKGKIADEVNVKVMGKISALFAEISVETELKNINLSRLLNLGKK